MLYEYRCEAGHVIEAHVKLSGEGTPLMCNVPQDPGRVVCGTEGCDYPAIALGIDGGVCNKHSFVTGWLTQVKRKPNVCGKPLTRILSVGSAYFPGAGSWRGA